MVNMFIFCWLWGGIRVAEGVAEVALNVFVGRMKEGITQMEPAEALAFLQTMEPILILLVTSAQQYKLALLSL